jgi:ABC-type branched-subunit amino acid transport system ATPase component
MIEGLTVRFGGITAVSDLSLQAPTGTITGLIGPNGAGKTTTFNVCTGMLRPSAGRVYLDGRDLGRMGVSHRARLGLGRTFQRMRLFDSLTVAENVALGRESGLAGNNPASQFVTLPGQRRAIREAADDAMALCGLNGLRDAPVGSLPTGKRRLVELARCLAGDFRMLLLDEPSSGLDSLETEHFAQILETIVSERDVGLLLVEHDLGLVMGVCSQIFVMDFGELIFSGSPEQVMASPAVQAAYLGGSVQREGAESNAT